MFAGIGWTVLGTAFGLYASQAGSFKLYGVLGGVLLMLVWFYLAGLVLLLGVAVNVTLTASIEDRQLQQAALREFDQQATMSEADGPTDEHDREPTGRADVVTQDELDELRADIEEFEERIEDRTVHRDELKADLRQYVRGRIRRGHARGWGPYLVLLYGTIMTVSAFYFLDGFWAVAAMIIVWLSTLGLYALMVLVGLVSGAFGLPGRVIDRVRNIR